MGIFVGRVRGITFRYAKNNISSFRVGDFLKLEHEPNNAYDSNAIAIYDYQLNHLGYVAREFNHEILTLITRHRYYCEITQVYYNSDRPSIEFRIIYDDGNINKNSFELKYGDYCECFSKLNDDLPDDPFDSVSDIFEDISVKNHSIMNPTQEHYQESIDKAFEFYDGANWAAAYNAFWQLAILNFKFAQYIVAYLLFTGKGVAQDYELSFMWFKRAIDNGSLGAIYFMGYFYELGIVVEKDLDKAIAYYEKACKHDSFKALNRLASMYFYGIGVEQNYSKCEELYLRSLEISAQQREEAIHNED